jgi:hypothetical protein
MDHFDAVERSISKQGGYENGIEKEQNKEVEQDNFYLYVERQFFYSTGGTVLYL